MTRHNCGNCGRCYNLPWITCQGAKLKRHNCPPHRQTIHGSSCLCQLDWSFKTDFKCGAEYGGCCNPTADPNGPFCPISGDLEQPEQCTSGAPVRTLAPWWAHPCDAVAVSQEPCTPWWRLNSS